MLAVVSDEPLTSPDVLPEGWMPATRVSPHPAHPLLGPDLLLQIPEYEALFVADLRDVLDRAYDPEVLAARHAARE